MELKDVWLMGSCLIVLFGILTFVLIWTATYGMRKEFFTDLKEFLFAIEPKDEPSTTI